MCRLAEKAVRQGHRLYIHADSEMEGQLIDERLWDYQPTSFLPHELYAGEASGKCPILIGHTLDHAKDCTPLVLMINLSTELPGCFAGYSRIIEIAHQDSALLTHLRKHFSTLQAAGYEMTTHNFSRQTSD